MQFFVGHDVVIVRGSLRCVGAEFATVPTHASVERISVRGCFFFLFLAGGMSLGSDFSDKIWYRVTNNENWRVGVFYGGRLRGGEKGVKTRAELFACKMKSSCA